jgi:aryl-alcohol dehydrogenase-like predicted oxidoreductase
MKPLPSAPFGRTGHLSTRALFGAAAFYDVDQPTADRTMDLIVERGVNHIDTASSYSKAELRLGPWLKDNRDSVFLATKTEQRTYHGARDELRRSLELMNVDNVDLWQMHILLDENDWKTAMGPGGALEAFVEARDEGLVKWLGVTGHGLDICKMHLRSLERFDFDTVLLPWNWTMSRNTEYAADFTRLHKLCMEKNVAFQLIKTVCHRSWREDENKTRDCWYKPLEDQGDLDAALHWAMGIEGSFINTVGDVRLLPRVLDAVADFDSVPSDEEIIRRAESGNWEPLFA